MNSLPCEYWLPHRPEDSHKGEFGTVVLVAGSRLYAGAAVLSALGASRSGAGLIYVVVPSSIVDRVATFEPSWIVAQEREDQDGGLASTAWPGIRDLLPRASAVVIGPGWGMAPGRSDLLRRLTQRVQGPAVLDADGLNLLADLGADLLRHSAGRWVLTPHPKEAARLLKTSTREVQTNRRNAATALHQLTSAVIVLKGHETVVADATRVEVNTTGNSGLATGGSGDVLAGLLGGLLAQGIEPFAAARAGVWIHGRAGDLLAGNNGISGFSPRELAETLPTAAAEVRC